MELFITGRMDSKRHVLTYIRNNDLFTKYYKVTDTYINKLNITGGEEGGLKIGTQCNKCKTLFHITLEHPYSFRQENLSIRSLCLVLKVLHLPCKSVIVSTPIFRHEKHNYFCYTIYVFISCKNITVHKKVF